MAVKDLGAYLADDVFDIPNVPSASHPDGKTYRVESPDAKTGLWLESVVSLGAAAAAGVDMSEEDADSIVLDDGEEVDLYRRALGATYDEMVADGVSWVRIQRIGRYALLYFTLGEEQADEALTNSGNSNSRRRGSRKASSAKATTTKRRASTAGTTSPRKRAKPRKRA